MDKELRTELIDGMKELSKNGYKCFILKENPTFLYGFMVTPKDNVIYIQENNFHMGWETTLEYKPSSKTGSGCRCLENPFSDITLGNIILSESEGLKFAKRLNAKLYESSESFMKQLYNKNDYEFII